MLQDALATTSYLTEHLHHLLFFKQFQDPNGEAVEMWGERPKVDRSRIGLERIHDASGKWLGNIERHQRRSAQPLTSGSSNALAIFKNSSGSF